MKPLYIFDLDGTLANCEHRQHFVQRPDCPHCHWQKPCDHSRDGTRPAFNPDWRAFFAACVGDTPIRPVIDTMAVLAYGGAEIWIFSGRSGEVNDETVAWLNDNVPNVYSTLRLRDPGDHTPDDELKSSWLNEMLADDRERLVGVFDDRDKVVAMWRAHGVRCFQVAPGAF